MEPMRRAGVAGSRQSAPAQWPELRARPCANLLWDMLPGPSCYGAAMFEETPSVAVRRYRRQHDADGTHAAYRSAITRTASTGYEQEQIAAWAGAEEVDLHQWDARRVTAHTFVAVTERRIAGFADFLDDGLLDMVFVHADFGRQGVARLLVATVKRKPCIPGCPLFARMPAEQPGPRSSSSGSGSWRPDPTTSSADRP